MRSYMLVRIENKNGYKTKTCEFIGSYFKCLWKKQLRQNDNGCEYKIIER